MIFKIYLVACIINSLSVIIGRCSLIAEIELVSFTSDGRLDHSGIRCDNGMCDNYFKLCVLRSDIADNCVKTDIVYRNNDNFAFPSELPNHNSSLPSIPNPFEIHVPEWPSKDSDKIITIEVHDWDKREDDLLYRNSTNISDIQTFGSDSEEPQVRVLQNSNGKTRTTIKVRLYCEVGFTGPGCSQRDTECHSNTCFNKGKCIETGKRVKCHCASGFTGDRCEVRLDPCKLGNCKYGNCTSALNTYTCECFPGYSGDDCDQDIDECDTSPCQNGGNCINLQPLFKCQCPSGRYGKLCEHDADECTSNPCLNNGMCTHSIDQFNCECIAGFEGELCEIDVDECDSSPCMNAGICIDEINSHKCVCHEGFEGQYCEYNIRKCSSSPCLNGGTCVDDVGTFTCICQDPFVGERCELDSMESGIEISVKDTNKLDLTELETKFSNLIKEHIPGTEDVFVQTFVPANQNQHDDLTQVVFVIYINNTMIAESDADKIINSIPEGERAKLMSPNTIAEDDENGSANTNTEVSSDKNLLEGMILGIIVFQAVIILLILVRWRRNKRYVTVERQDEPRSEETSPV
ncbi:uncharacterized protein [Antedon mediterranea]|uniref:uncharacterized protein n=1 Tax=Antedon mediterranea TaxID=105859 RepID=UPI003AF816B6